MDAWVQVNEESRQTVLFFMRRGMRRAQEMADEAQEYGLRTTEKGLRDVVDAYAAAIGALRGQET